MRPPTSWLPSSVVALPKIAPASTSSIQRSSPTATSLLDELEVRAQDVGDVGVGRRERDDRLEQLAHRRAPAALLDGHAQRAEARTPDQVDRVVGRAHGTLALGRARTDLGQQRRELIGPRPDRRDHVSGYAGSFVTPASSSSSTASSVPSSGSCTRRSRKWRNFRISSS